MRQELIQTKKQLKQVTYVLLNLGYLSSYSHPPPSPQHSSDNEDDEYNDHIKLDDI